MRTTYAIGIGSNRRGRHGSPRAEVTAAIEALPDLVVAAPIIETAPLGPSHRRFANSVAIIVSDEPPPMLLARLKAIERAFGRRGGRRWGARVIDLDILLWSRGSWSSPGLTVPHIGLRERRFVLSPLAAIAPQWRDPVTRRSIRQLAASVDRPRPRH
jgi:2-amino-4-hydroxy-6-hydroxymethyldihydropteridine diphosphokinase